MIKGVYQFVFQGFDIWGIDTVLGRDRRLRSSPIVKSGFAAIRLGRGRASVRVNSRILRVSIAITLSPRKAVAEGHRLSWLWGWDWGRVLAVWIPRAQA